jgi:hypothetical protein
MNPDRSRIELYDIPRDPSQLTNLAAENSETVERLAALLLAWQKTLPPGRTDPGAGRNDYPGPRAAPGSSPHNEGEHGARNPK